MIWWLSVVHEGKLIKRQSLILLCVCSSLPVAGLVCQDCPWLNSPSGAAKPEESHFETSKAWCKNSVWSSSHNSHMPGAEILVPNCRSMAWKGMVFCGEMVWSTGDVERVPVCLLGKPRQCLLKEVKLQVSITVLCILQESWWLGHQRRILLMVFFQLLPKQWLKISGNECCYPHHTHRMLKSGISLPAFSQERNVFVL